MTNPTHPYVAEVLAVQSEMGAYAPTTHPPHEFVGRLDRWCELCNRPDRHEVHQPPPQELGVVGSNIAPELVRLIPKVNEPLKHAWNGRKYIVTKFIEDGAYKTITLVLTDAEVFARDGGKLMAITPMHAPIDVILPCPRCGWRHVDKPDGDWTNPPHRSHLCFYCGFIWRPADVPTNGVEVIKTHGKNDSPRPRVDFEPFNQGMSRGVLQLCKFYGVVTTDALVVAQAQHIERLQQRLPPLVDNQPRTPREG